MIKINSAIKTLVVATFLISLLSGGLAQSDVPDLPHSFYGEVTVNGEDVQESVVEVRSDGEVLDSVETQDSSYGGSQAFDEKLLAQGVEQDAKLNFYIDGLKADQTENFNSSQVQELDLTAQVPEDEPSRISSVGEPSDGIVKVMTPEIINDRETSVYSLTMEVDQETDENVEVNITQSDTEIEESNIENEELEGTEPQNYIKVNTDIENEKVENADIGFSVGKSGVEDPEELLVIHFDEGEREEVIEPEYMEDESENSERYVYTVQTNSFSTFVAAEDTEDPSAEIMDDDRTVDLDEELEFQASASDNTEVESVEWSFGDGEGADGDTVEHEYSSTGDYTVTLTVTDRAGNEETDTVEVTVEDDGGSSSAPSIDTGDDEVTDEEDDSEESESDSDTDGTEDQTDSTNESQESPTDEGQTGQQEGSQEEESDTQEEQPGTGSAPTGLFGTSPSQIGLGIIALALIALLAAHRTGRVDLTEIPEKASSIIQREEESTQE